MRRTEKISIFYWILIFILVSGCSLSYPNVGTGVIKTEKPGVILIHGYGNLLFTDTDLVNWTMTDLYWGRWVENAFSDTNVAYIYWDASKRIESQLGDIVGQFNKHLKKGHCDTGCLLFTHSTGGMVSDIVLSRSYESRGTKNDFSIIWDQTIASVNIASASGGVGLATTLTNLVMGNCVDAVSLVFPFVECGKPSSLGAGHDLRPEEARFINHADKVRTPSLMVAGYGLMAPSLMRLSLLGNNDGLVAMHSSCGGNRFPESEKTAPDSCSPGISPEGKIKSRLAPDLYKFHYPIIMTREGHGSQLRRGLVNIDIVSDKTETLILYNEDGTPMSTIPLAYQKYDSLTLEKDDAHLADLMGDLMRLNKKRLPPANPSEKKLTQQDFRGELKKIYNSFESLMSYPAHSIPLNQQDYALLNPNAPNTYFETFDNSEFTATIDLPAYLFFEGGVIPVRLLARGINGHTRPDIKKAEGKLLNGEGEEVVSFPLLRQPSKANETVFEYLLPPEELPAANLAEEVNLKVIFTTASQKRHHLNRMIKHIPSTAEVQRIDVADIIGSNLVIPVSITTRKPGTYQLTANLFAKSDMSPIAHLTSQTGITGSDGIINLKVDGSLLRNNRNQSPYILKDLSLSRIPDSFDEQREYGNAAGISAEIKQFDLNKLKISSEPPPSHQVKIERFRRFIESL